jgi:hypothetical protein
MSRQSTLEHMLDAIGARAWALIAYRSWECRAAESHVMCTICRHNICVLLGREGQHRPGAAAYDQDKGIFDQRLDSSCEKAPPV